MDDLTLLYYTANLVEEPFGTNIRNRLVWLFAEEIRIISISQKPMMFGDNICIEGLEPSIYNIYRQILAGAKEATTKYVACCEDDALYNFEHFSYRPEKDTFAYNINRWNVNPDLYFHRKRANMSMCIAPRELLIDTLERRFEKYPRLLSREEMGAIGGFGEPGKFEAKYGLPVVKRQDFYTQHPTLVFNHRPSVGGVRKIMEKDEIKTELPEWGKASNLWRMMYEKIGFNT